MCIEQLELFVLQLDLIRQIWDLHWFFQVTSPVEYMATDENRATEDVATAILSHTFIWLLGFAVMYMNHIRFCFAWGAVVFYAKNTSVW